MVTAAMSELEREFCRLSPEAQLTLLERLIHKVRLSQTPEALWESELVKMSNDSQIQAEINRINSEFAPADTDGLARD